MRLIIIYYIWYTYVRKYVVELNLLEYKKESLISKIELNNPNLTNPGMPITSVSYPFSFKFYQ